MANRPDRHTVESEYRAGVRAVSRISRSFDDATWQQVVCGTWTATETARHLVSVAGWYHDWMDRAEAGERSLPFPAAEMDERTAAGLVAVGELDGITAVAEFVDSAMRYIDRVLPNWDLRYAYPGGRVTAGLHFGIAATEWHLHAWDLSTATDTRHEPANPAGLFDAAASCQAAAAGLLRGPLIRLAIPFGRRGRPWKTLLEQSGRTP